MKVCSNGLCHMTNRAVMPIYVKTLKNLLLWIQKASDLERLYAASGTQVFSSSNDDTELTLTYFTSRSNLIPCAFVWKKG